jgi:hypothetical protein
MGFWRKIVSLLLPLGLVASAGLALATAAANPAQAATGCSYCWGLFQNNDMYSDSLGGHFPPTAIQYLSWTSGGTTGPNATDIADAEDEGISPFLELQTNCGGCSLATEEGYFSDLLAGDYTSNLKAFGTAIANDETSIGGDTASLVFLTWDHEPNEPSTCADDWYPWGTGCETAADWIKAWNIVTTDVDSTCQGWCTWVWAPNVGSDSSISSYWSNSGNHVSSVDWKGLDCYLEEPTDTWSGSCESSWTEVSSLTGGGDDFGPILTETGVNQAGVNSECTYGGQEMTCADAQLSQIVDGVGSNPGYVFYFDEDKSGSGGTDWSLTSAEATCFLSLEGVGGGSC